MVTLECLLPDATAGACASSDATGRCVNVTTPGGNHAAIWANAINTTVHNTADADGSVLNVHIVPCQVPIAKSQLHDSDLSISSTSRRLPVVNHEKVASFYTQSVGREGGAIFIELWGINPQGSALPTTPVITSMPTRGQLFLLDYNTGNQTGRVVNGSAVGLQGLTQGHAVIYQPNAHESGTNFDSFMYRMEVAGHPELTSASTTLKIDVTGSNNVPEASKCVLTFDEDSAGGWVNLTVRDLEQPQCEDLASSRCTLEVYISKLPTKGRLFAEGDNSYEMTQGTSTYPITTPYDNYYVGGDRLQQYASRVVGVSSFWGSNPLETGYHPINIIGPPDCSVYNTECAPDIAHGAWIYDESLPPGKGSLVRYRQQLADGSSYTLPARVFEPTVAGTTDVLLHLLPMHKVDESTHSAKRCVICLKVARTDGTGREGCSGSSAPTASTFNQMCNFDDATVTLRVARKDVLPSSNMAWSPAKQNPTRDIVLSGGAPSITYGSEFNFTIDYQSYWDHSEYDSTPPVTEFIEFGIDTPVLITEIELGMPRGMGAIVRILARGTLSPKWQVIYEDAPLRGLRHAKLHQYWKWSPDICRPHVFVDEFRIELDTSELTGIADWNYIDWVKVTGSRKSQPGLLPRGTRRVWYEPFPHENGFDSFTYGTSDCGGAISRMSLGAKADITINAINDRPDVTASGSYAWDRPWITQLQISNLTFLDGPATCSSTEINVGYDLINTRMYAPELVKLPVFDVDDEIKGADSDRARNLTIRLLSLPGCGHVYRVHNISQCCGMPREGQNVDNSCCSLGTQIVSGGDMTLQAGASVFYFGVDPNLGTSDCIADPLLPLSEADQAWCIPWTVTYDANVHTYAAFHYVVRDWHGRESRQAVQLQLLRYTAYRRTLEIVMSAALIPVTLFVCIFCMHDCRKRHIKAREYARFTSTDWVPTLTLAEGQIWHMFISHTWATGQDQAHALKRQCRTMMPDVKIFLDVDDLESIDKLETYIEQSACVLLFISRGYFQSKNCLIEICAALKHRKPLILVYEPTENKGGGNLAKLQAECPEDLARQIFIPIRLPVQFMRQSEFQHATLYHILARMLLASPKYGHLIKVKPPAAELPAFASTSEHCGPCGAAPATDQADPDGRESVAPAEASVDAPASALVVSLPSTSVERGIAVASSEIHEAPSGSAPPANKKVTIAKDRSEMQRASDADRPRQSWSDIEEEMAEVQLYSRDSILAKPLRLPNAIQVYVSKYNRGAEALMQTMIHVLGTDLSILSNVDAVGDETPFLLFLNALTFRSKRAAANDKLAEDVRKCMKRGAPIVLVHWATVPFEGFFSVTPQDLLLAGLYKDHLAVPFFPPGPQQPVSIASLAYKLGAKACKSSMVPYLAEIGMQSGRKVSRFGATITVQIDDKDDANTPRSRSGRRRKSPWPTDPSPNRSSQDRGRRPAEDIVQKHPSQTFFFGNGSSNSLSLNRASSIERIEVRKPAVFELGDEFTDFDEMSEASETFAVAAELVRTGTFSSHSSKTAFNPAGASDAGMEAAVV